jgi:hypothetical protein
LFVRQGDFSHEEQHMKILKALAILVAFSMLTTIAACLHSDSAGASGSNWDEARISALEQSVADLQDENAELRDALDELTARVDQIRVATNLRVGGSGASLMALTDNGGSTPIGQVVHHLPQQEFRRSSRYEAVSNTGYLFEVPATQAVGAVAIGWSSLIFYDQTDCMGQAYVGQTELGSAGASQGWVLRPLTGQPGEADDPANYFYVPAGEALQPVTIHSWWNNGAQTCEHPVEPSTDPVYAVLPNNEAETGVPSGQLMGPTIMGE